MIGEILIFIGTLLFGSLFVWLFWYLLKEEEYVLFMTIISGILLISGLLLTKVGI